MGSSLRSSADSFSTGFSTAAGFPMLDGGLNPVGFFSPIDCFFSVGAGLEAIPFGYALTRSSSNTPFRTSLVHLNTVTLFFFASASVRPLSIASALTLPCSDWAMGSSTKSPLKSPIPGASALYFAGALTATGFFIPGFVALFALPDVFIAVFFSAGLVELTVRSYASAPLYSKRGALNTLTFFFLAYSSVITVSIGLPPCYLAWKAIAIGSSMPYKFSIGVDGASTTGAAEIGTFPLALVRGLTPVGASNLRLRGF